MKKFLLFLMTLMVLAAPQVMKAQVTIGDLETATTDSYLPMNSLYEYSYSQQIYTADEIGMAGTINSITVWLYGNENLYEMPFDIYMVETDKEAFESSTDWVPVTSSDLVYSGSITVHNTTAEAYTFVLSTPFVYSGTGNLLISFDNNTGQWKSGLNGMVFTAEDGALRAIYARRDDTDYDPFNMASISAYGTTAKRNVIELDITPSSGPTCERPDNFEVSNITGYGADFAWTGTVGNYTFEYKKASESDWTVVTGITVNSYSLNTLESYTTYNVRVKAVCGVDLESSYKSASFTTPEVCPDGLLCIGTGSTATSYYLPANNYYNYSLSQQIYTAAELGGEAGAILSIDFYKASDVEMEKILDIYMVNTNKISFDSTTDWIAVTAADLVFSGTVTFADNDWTTIELDAPFVFDGSSNVALIVDNNTGEYVSSTPFRTFSTGETNQAIYQYSDGTNVDPLAAITTAGSLSAMKNHIRLNIVEPPACPRPTGVTVNYTDGTEATVSWTSDATSFNIDVNGVVTNNVPNPYTITGLELATEYSVMLQADCGSDGVSDWTNAVNFTTDACMPEDMIIVNYELTDSYGDGWNNNAILVVDDNCYIAEQLTISSGSSNSGTLRVCGSAINFYWYKGSYPGEASWVFTNTDGDTLFFGTGTTDMQTLDLLYTIDLNPYVAPSDIEVSEVSNHTAVVSWTENGTATAWQIQLANGENESIIDVNTNPFTLTGLDPETDYTVNVRAAGPAGTSLWPCLYAEFTTDVPCPKPTELVVNPFVTSAEISWNGFADAYDLEWAVMPASETRDGGIWLQYDDGTVVTNVGNSTVYEWTWAAMYPASMLEGNGLLSKVAFYETSYYSNGDPITINIYSGGDSEPETLVYTENVTCTGTVGIHEVALSDLVNVDPSQNLWITLTSTTIDRPMAMSAVDEANGRWVDNGGWIDIGSALSSVAAYTFMIRGYVEPSFDPSELEWTSVSGVTSPYTIEGLDAETTYIVRVKANCGGEDGESDWTQTSFTTASACDLPNSLVSEVNGTTATLKWNGYQDNINLKYRAQSSVDPSTPATIILEAHDAWGDGTGYQMLLDADATAYGNEIPESGPYTGSDYSAFEYLIPGNADCDANTENLVFDGSVTLEIPAGVYDWCIVNPEPSSGNMWIAGTGDIPGRYDDFVFEPGVTYHFTMQTGFGTGDGAVFEVTRPMGDWIVVNNVTSPYELTGLDPETYYEWQVEGINSECGGELVSEIANFITGEQAPQVIALVTGMNWVSFNVETNLDELKAALVEALPGTQIQIVGQNSQTTYNGARWRGTLTWNLASMYKIKVSSVCEITLQGAPIDPAAHPVTINNGNNWIAFPLNQSMTLNEAFAGFAISGDQVSSQTGVSLYTTRWRGNVTALEPGKGYVYKNGSEPRTFVFPSIAR